MSRLIVKNLPKETKEQSLRELFSQKGVVTDCSLKYTKSGIFRKFAFVGFSSENEAKAAQQFFDKTFFKTSRIQVDFAKDLSDPSKPRAWSKYSSDSSLHMRKPEVLEKIVKEKTQKKELDKKIRNDKKMDALFGELKNDPEFQEFLAIHKNISTKETWANDAERLKIKSQNDKNVNSRDSDNDLKEEKDSSQDETGVNDQWGEEELLEQKSPEKGKQLSDLEYLKTKMIDASLSSDEEEEKKRGKKKKKKDKETELDEQSTVEEKISPKQLSTKAQQKFLLKMKGLPANVREKMIREFFKPITGIKVRIPTNANKNPIGIAFVEFRSEKDLESAMGKNKNFISGKKIFLKKNVEEAQPVEEEKPRPWELKKLEDDENQETVAESGRLFVRNLAYICTEEALEKLFSKYGPIAEFELPVDTMTKKVKGFAHITFMIPEHAVKAFSELDGTSFMGRMLHILPGRSNDEKYESSELSSFKKKKDEKTKTLAKSSHNWNTLFLGPNAVATAMAEKYGTEKSHILDDSGKGTLSVRMALGETQLVVETREFLLINNVALDSFSQAAGERSKTVILAKNLPAGTKEEELREIFGKYGTLNRILLPPFGITAIIEFLEPTEAKRAFTKLAYSKFHHLPLYLEWAPMNVFTKSPSQPLQEEGKQMDAEESSLVGEQTVELPKTEEKSDSKEEGEPGSSIFIKNINFNTEENSLRELFSKCGKVLKVTIAKKKDMKNPGQLLSMGYGFLEYKSASSAQDALKTLQHAVLDEHQLELKLSIRETVHPKVASRKKAKETKQKSTKILVRNIPFQAKRQEIEELFKVFGELKYVRLPKKLSGTGTHRGFAFVDFLTKQDAKRAFEALCHSTHLYGRRLVLEWAETEETIDDLRRKTADHFHGGGPSKKLKKSRLLESLE